MNTRWTSVGVSLVLCAAFSARSEEGSTLRLEASAPEKCPFQRGDSLEIRDDMSGTGFSTRATVMDARHWPWVYVKSGEAELWVNFNRVVAVRYAVAGK
jgi:hypothetical protein